MSKAAPCVDAETVVYVETASEVSIALSRRPTRQGLRFYILGCDGKPVDVSKHLAVERGVKLRWQFVPKAREAGDHHLMILFSPNNTPSAKSNDHARFVRHLTRSKPMRMRDDQDGQYSYSAVLWRDRPFKVKGQPFPDRECKAVADTDPVIIIRDKCSR